MAPAPEVFFFWTIDFIMGSSSTPYFTSRMRWMFMRFSFGFSFCCIFRVIALWTASSTCIILSTLKCYRSIVFIIFSTRKLINREIRLLITGAKL